jgi:hypothetical protein
MNGPKFRRVEDMRGVRFVDPDNRELQDINDQEPRTSAFPRSTRFGQYNRFLSRGSPSAVITQYDDADDMEDNSTEKNDHVANATTEQPEDKHENGSDGGYDTYNYLENTPVNPTEEQMEVKHDDRSDGGYETIDRETNQNGNLTTEQYVKSNPQPDGQDNADGDHVNIPIGNPTPEQPEVKSDDGSEEFYSAQAWTPSDEKTNEAPPENQQAPDEKADESPPNRPKSQPNTFLPQLNLFGNPNNDTRGLVGSRVYNDP